MERRIGVLLNPSSGKGRVVRNAAGTLTRMRLRGDQVVAIEGESAARSERLLADAMAAGLDALVAVGGDGTVHMALQAVAGTDTALGIIPLGTGNDAARELGIPLGDRDGAVDVILAGHERAFDTGVVETSDGRRRHFVCILSTGFDSLVNERANRMRWPSGQARYVLAMLAELRTFRPIPYQVSVDGVASGQQAMLVSVGNGSSFGGGMRMCPSADLHDGLLNMVVLGPMARWDLVRTFPKVYSGRHMSHPAASERVGRILELDAPGQVAYADGERIGPLPVTVRAEPDSVRVLVPADG
ncbi:MAG: diacylglycerol kinase [Candidatus Nanopelagicales bacterium]